MKAQFIALALLSAGYSQAFAALVVDLDLGLLDAGETSIAGQVTAPPAGNAIAYASPFQNYAGGEVVFEFAIEQDMEASLTSGAFEGGDPDAFLLNSLDVVEGQATGTIATAYLDGALGSTAGFGVLAPGTYFLSVEGYQGGTPTFEYTLGLSAFVLEAPTAADLGIIGDESSIVSLDTFGSDVGDTELGVYDAAGTLIGINDDSAVGGTFQSSIALEGLPEGTYYVAAGAYNSVFGDNFQVVGGTSEGGGIFLNTGEGGPQGAAAIAPGEVAWFSFGIVPEPSSMSLIALAGLTLLGRRRR